MEDDGLSVVDIGTFCLLTKKYQDEIREAGVNDINDTDYFLEECSKSVSEQLQIMDNCQQMLWKYGFDTNNTEKMLEAKAMFEEGIHTLQSVLKAFESATCGKRQ